MGLVLPACTPGAESPMWVMWVMAVRRPMFVTWKPFVCRPTWDTASKVLSPHVPIINRTSLSLSNLTNSAALDKRVTTRWTFYSLIVPIALYSICEWLHPYWFWICPVPCYFRIISALWDNLLFPLCLSHVLMPAKVLRAIKYNQSEYQYITRESVMDYYSLNLDLEGWTKFKENSKIS